MDKLRTATGKEFDCDLFVSTEVPRRVYIRILNTPIAVVATVFSDRRETVKLFFGDDYKAQYTNLVSIMPESGAIQIMLAKE